MLLSVCVQYVKPSHLIQFQYQGEMEWFLPALLKLQQRGSSSGGDVFCFIDAVRKSLLIDYNEDISIKKMTEMVMYEFYERLHHYSQFHQGSNQLISDAKRFFKKKEYHLNVVDVCIVAIANVLQVNLAIFEKVNREVVLINHQCTIANTKKTIYLKYSHDLGDHYVAIVNIEIPTEEVQSEDKEKETNGQQSEDRSEAHK